MGAVATADEAAVLWLNDLVGRFPWFDGLMRLLVGDYLAPVLLALMLLGMWFGAPLPAGRVRQQTAVLCALIGMALGNLATLIINQLVFRPRPFVDHPLTLLFYQPTDSSFPANPAVVGFALAAGIWRGNRRMGVAAYAVASIWGFSRVYAGVTYPSDVLAGAALGVAVTLVACAALRRIEPLPTLALRLARRFHLA
jgi:undecaprenyl-diphosphatase